MPELPEVETTRRGIESHILKLRVHKVLVREPQLRWKIPASLSRQLPGQTIESIKRRGKYLLLSTASNCLIIHLGMSGSLRIVADNAVALKHDHVDILFENNKILRYRDPRKFGAMFWTNDQPLQHPRLIDLGIEPFDKHFNGRYLHQAANNKQQAVKTFIMDSKQLVGVGNIYANEALFLAGIHPVRAAGRISLERYTLLANAIRKVLRNAIKSGGTSLKDFTQTDGQPGYFAVKLNVYDKQGMPCPTCGNTIKQIKQAQRSSYYCSVCQT